MTLTNFLISVVFVVVGTLFLKRVWLELIANKALKERNRQIIKAWRNNDYQALDPINNQALTGLVNRPGLKVSKDGKTWIPVAPYISRFALNEPYRSNRSPQGDEFPYGRSKLMK